MKIEWERWYSFGRVTFRREVNCSAKDFRIASLLMALRSLIGILRGAREKLKWSISWKEGMPSRESARRQNSRVFLTK